MPLNPSQEGGEITLQSASLSWPTRVCWLLDVYNFAALLVLAPTRSGQFLGVELDGHPRLESSVPPASCSLVGCIIHRPAREGYLWRLPRTSWLQHGASWTVLNPPGGTDENRGGSSAFNLDRIPLVTLGS
jgi:hypothetical protein